MTATASPLIPVAELAAVLDAPGSSSPSSVPVLLDVRWSLTGPPGIEAYRAGHLPGARFIDLDTQLAAAPGSGGRHPLPAAEAFQAAMREAGVDDGRPVVVYDAADSTAAARAWWLLRYYGHQDVRVLDGGYAAWLAAGLSVTDPVAADHDEPARSDGDFTARPGHLPILDAQAAGNLAKTGVLLDARATPRYRGEAEPVDPVAGHIPGAISAPTMENVAEDGRFQPADKLAARFADLIPNLPSSDAEPTHEVGVYCGSGVTAAHEVLALTVAEIPAALYVGSWSEWITDPGRPIATGAGPTSRAQD
jgi:thiosulfate/3-mercaptopyruvate sulfurtransferase